VFIIYTSVLATIKIILDSLTARVMLDAREEMGYKVNNFHNQESHNELGLNSSQQPANGTCSEPLNRAYHFRTHANGTCSEPLKESLSLQNSR
jgi:hypothetical protein